MALENIGLEAIFKDENFQAGIKRYQQGIGQASDATDKGASLMSRLGSIASGALTIGIGAATAAIGAFIAISKIGLDTTLEWSESVEKLTKQFGMSGEEGSKWAVAMQHVGLSVDEGAAGLNFFTKNLDDAKKAMASSKVETKDNSEKIGKLNQQLADASTRLERAKIKMGEAKKPTKEMQWAVDDAQKTVNRLNAELSNTPKVTSKVKEAAEKLTPFQKALQKLGVSAYDSKGKMKDFNSIMPEIMDAFKKLPAGVESSALAMDLFGARGGTKFLEFLRQGKQGLKDADAFAREFGLTISTETVEAAEEFGFAMNDMKMALTGIWNQIGMAVLPIVKQLVDYINKNVLPVFAAWAKDVGPKLQNALKIIADTFGWFVKELQKGNLDVALNTLVTNLLMLVGVDDELANSLGDFAASVGKWITKTAIPALQGFVKWVKDNWPKVQKAIQDAWNNYIKPALEKFANFIVQVVIPALQQLGDWVRLNFPKMQKAIEDFWKKAEPILREFEKWLESDGIKALETFFNKMGEMKGVSDKWVGFMEKITGSEEKASSDMVKDAGIQFPKLADILSWVMDSMKTRSESQLGILSGIWQAKESLMQGDWMKFADNVNEIFYELFRGMLAQIGVNIPNFEAGFRDLQNRVQAIIRDMAGNLAGSMAGGMQAMYNTVVAWTGSIVSAFTSIFSQAANAIQGFNFNQAVYNMMSGVWNTINGWVGSILSVIVRPFNDASNWLRNFDFAGQVYGIVANVWGIINNWADRIFHALYDPFSNAIEQIKHLLNMGSPSRTMMDIGAQMAAGLMQGFNAPTLSYSLAANTIPIAVSGAGGNVRNISNTVYNNYTLNMQSLASASTLAADFGILRSLGGA